MNLRIVGAGVRALIVPLSVAVVLSTFTYALTNSNTVPGTNVGTGATAVAGFTVTEVHYNLNSDDPRNVESVQFTLSPAPGANPTVKAKIESGSSTFAACTLAGATATCPTGGTAAGANELSVVVGQ